MKKIDISKPPLIDRVWRWSSQNFHQMLKISWPRILLRSWRRLNPLGKLVAASAAFADSFINTTATRAPVSEKIYTPLRRGGRISPRFMNTGRYGSALAAATWHLNSGAWKKIGNWGMKKRQEIGTTERWGRSGIQGKSEWVESQINQPGLQMHCGAHQVCSEAEKL